MTLSEEEYDKSLEAWHKECEWWDREVVKLGKIPEDWKHKYHPSYYPILCDIEDCEDRKSGRLFTKRGYYLMHLQRKHHLVMEYNESSS